MVLNAGRAGCRWRAGRLALLVGCLAAAGSGAPAAAQEATVRVEPRGWLGFTFTTEAAPRPGGLRVVVRSVVEGSPAQQAGLREGDRIVAFDGRPVSEEVLLELSRLPPGRPVRVRLDRDGRSRDLRIVSAAREPAVLVLSGDGRAVRFSVDSVVQAVSVLLDSARHTARVGVRSIYENEPPRGAVYFLDERGELQGTDSRERLREVERLGSGQLAELRAIQRAESARLLEAMRVGADQTDELQASLRRLQEELRAREREGGASGWVARAEPGRESLFRAQRPPGSTRGAGAAPAPPGAAEYSFARGPLSGPFSYGERAAAGAVFAEMNAGLGDYFGVDRGLLVLAVSPGTPADRGGLREGDVIVTASGASVGSLGDLRRHLADAGPDGIRVEVVRKGKRHSLRLPR